MIKLNLVYKIFSLSVVLSFSFIVQGQVNGDYRTRANGNWNANTTWQVRSGGAWVNCAAGDYPGVAAGAGTVTLTNNVTLNVNPANAISGLIVGANLTPNNANRNLTVNGDVSISAGTLNLSANNGRVFTLTLSGNFSISGGTITETANSYGSIVFNKSGTQTFTKTGGTISNNINFTINSGSDFDIGLNVLNGSTGTFTLSSGATFTTANAEGISSAGATGSIQSTGTRTFNTGANYVYNGTVAQVTGTGLPGTVNNLTINNAAGVTLTGGVTVSNILTMTLGNIKTGVNTLTLANSTSTKLVYTNGTITGKFQRAIGLPTGTEYLYPVGTSTSYNPLKITFSNLTAGQLAVQFQPNDIGTSGLPLNDAGTEIFDRQTTGYWTLTAVAPMASTSYNVNLNYSGFTGIDALARVISRTNGGNLTLTGTHGTVSSPEITRTGLSGISTTTTDLAIGKPNPRITTQPSDFTGCSASFNVAASGKASLIYQWQENNGSGFTNITNGGIYSGAASTSLTISGATESMNGYLYQCIVTDGLGYTTTSTSATLSVSLPEVTLGYNYSSDITIDPASGSSDLTDFPVLISISTSPDRDRLRTIANGGHVFNSNGYDIVFTDQDDIKLDHQIESYNAVTGQYVAWIRIPLLSHTAATTIKMLYGNSTVSSNPSVTSVWVSSYKGVWHLNGTDYTDATINANNGIENATSNATGKIAGGRGFNGTTSYIMTSTTGFVPNNNNQTISIWGNYAITPSGNRNLISFQNAAASSAIQLGFRGGNAVAWKWGGVILANGGTAPSINTWHYYVYTYDGTTSRIYIDGIEKNNSAVAPQTSAPSEGDIGRYNNGEYLAASLDETRFSMSPKSADWILTEYNNQNDPANFITIGTENNTTLLTSMGVCSTTYSLNQGSPSGGTYSGPGVTGTNFNASVAGVGTHSISYFYTDVNGCSNSVSKNIVVTAGPAAPSASNKECCILNILDLEASGTNLKWYSDAGLTTLVGTGTPFATGKTTAGVYTYYVTQTNNGCESAATAVSLTVYNNITINTQPQPSIICEGGNASFTVDASGYSLTYQWQENSVNISDGGIYSGTTSATLTLTDPGITKSGSSYRCIVTSSCGTPPVNSNSALLTVTVLPVATFSYTGNPYCPNAANPSPTFSGGGVAGTFSSTAGLVFVSSATGQVDLAASTPGNYTVTNTIPASGGCGIVAATSPITIISDLTWTGAVSSDWNIPGNWSCGLVPNLTTNVQILNVANQPVLNSGAVATVNNITIDIGSSLTISGNKIQISGTITNNGTFTVTDGTLEMNGNAAQSIGLGVFAGNTIKDLIINNAAGVSLLGPLFISGTVLLQNGDLSSDGNLTLLSTASQTALIDGAGTGDVTGNVTMERYLPTGFGYKYFSSPFNSSTVSEFADDMTLGSYTFYRYDENRTASGWVNYNNPANILNPLEGYSINFGTDPAIKTVDVTGVVNNGNLSVTLYNHNYTYTKGFNLVGNPYPSPIDWNAAVGWIKTNIDNALYYFKASATDQYGGTYSTYINGISSDGISNNIIPSMQGFYVHVSDGGYPVTGTLGMNNNVRITDLTHPFASKKGSATVASLLRLTARFSDDASSVDPMVIYFDEKGTSEFDNQIDALKLLNTDLKIPNLYTVSTDGFKISINALPPISGDLCKVPLGIKNNRTGTGTITVKISDIDESLTGYRIFITDIVAGIEQDLLPDKEFNVSLPKGEYNSRFYLNFSDTGNLTAVTEEHTNTPDLFSIYSTQGILKAQIGILQGNYGLLSIYNISGQILFSEKIYVAGYHEFSPELKAGIYVVNFSSGMFRTSRKLFIKVP